jgi:hypothetical protein
LEDRLEFVKDLYKAVEAIKGYNDVPSSEITALSGIIADINQLRMAQQDDTWENRMLASTSALEKMKTVYSASAATALTPTTSRAAAEAALAKAYQAYNNSGQFSVSRIMEYFTDAENELVLLRNDANQREFADYNLAVCYYLTGTFLARQAGSEPDAWEYYVAGRSLVSGFTSKAELVAGFKVAGLDPDLYNPVVLKARIDLAIDSLEDMGYGGG